MSTNNAGSATGIDLAEIAELAHAAPQIWYGTYQIADGITDENAVALIEACSPDTVLALIALARATPQHPEAPANGELLPCPFCGEETAREDVEHKQDCFFAVSAHHDIDVKLCREAWNRRATPQHSVTFPERDQSKPADQQGLFRKFDVRRVDGSDQPGGKHFGCRYYVLDLTHDQHAPAAMRAYAAACAATHPQLAADIEAEFGAQHSVTEQAKFWYDDSATFAIQPLHDDAWQASIMVCNRKFGKYTTPLYIAKPLASTAATQPEQASELPPLPETEGLADIEYAQRTPDDWDSDYRATWQKLQVAERNKMQWRAYALQLRAALAIPASTAASEQQASVSEADLAKKLDRVAKWIDSFPIGTDRATTMYCLVRNVQDALSGRATIPSEAAERTSTVAGYSIKHVAGHGWIIDPPQGSRWIAFDDTPAGDFMAALTHRATTATAGHAGVISGGEYDRTTGAMYVTVKLPKDGLPVELLTIGSAVSLAAAPDTTTTAADQQGDTASASGAQAGIVGASLDSYSPEDQAFFKFWYGHMKNEVMQSPLSQTWHSTARYIWDAALAQQGAAQAQAGADAHDAERYRWLLSSPEQVAWGHSSTAQRSARAQRYRMPSTLQWPHRQPVEAAMADLTDEKILQIAAEHDYGDEAPKCITRLARAIEQACRAAPSSLVADDGRQAAAQTSAKPAETRMDAGSQPLLSVADDGLPPLPPHPEPRVMRWSDMEARTIRQAQREAYEAGRVAAVPDSWKLVPVEPTGEQLRAELTFDASGCQMGEIYRSMLDAAPQPPKEKP